MNLLQAFISTNLQKAELTEKGQHIIETLFPFIKELRAIGYKDIDQDDFRVFLKVLDQIWHNYEKVDV